MKSTGIKFYDEDQWALMTSQALFVLSYEDKEAIPINLKTGVSKRNIFSICDELIKYCGEDNECTTMMDTEKIQVWLSRREGYFEVKLGILGLRFGRTYTVVRSKFNIIFIYSNYYYQLSNNA